MKSDRIRVKSVATLLPAEAAKGLLQGIDLSSNAPWPWTNYTWGQMQSFHRHLLRGHGFWGARIAAVPAEKSGENTADISRTGPMATCLGLPPRADVFESIPADALKKILGKHQATSSPGFREYARSAQLGLMVFPGFAGSGKTTAASVMVNAMLANPHIKRIYVSGPTNAAVSHICQRIDQIRVELVQEGDSVEIISQLRRAVVLRGFQLEIEEDQVMQRLRAPRGQHRSGMAGNIWHPSSWALDNSLAFFTLQALGFVSDEVPGLDDQSNPLLLSLRDSLATCNQIAGLRSLASGKITHEEYLAGRKCSKNNFRDLQRKVASCASVICTTPEASANSFFEPLKRTSDVSVLSAAGAMCRADAITVWGNACRPCIIIGDWKQMEPAMLSSQDRFCLGDDYSHLTGQSGLPRNRFVKDGEASILEHVMRTGHPVWNLDHQYRMAVGQFDLALSVVYQEVSKTYSYDDSTKLVHRPLAVQVDTWLSSKYGIASPEGRCFPAFFSKPGSCRLHDASSSRYNEEQNRFALDLVRGLHEAGIPKRSMKVVTTYSENKLRLEDHFRKASFIDVACHTVDSFNGGIGSVIILVLCVNRVSGPCFTDDDRRLAVSITRHTDHLIVIGDMYTMSSFDREKHRAGAMNAMLSWFSRNNRVVVIDHIASGDDPRNTTKTIKRFEKGKGWVTNYRSTTKRKDARSKSAEKSVDVGSDTKGKAEEGENKPDGQ